MSSRGGQRRAEAPRLPPARPSPSAGLL